VDVWEDTFFQGFFAGVTECCPKTTEMGAAMTRQKSAEKQRRPSAQGNVFTTPAPAKKVDEMFGISIGSVRGQNINFRRQKTTKKNREKNVLLTPSSLTQGCQIEPKNHNLGKFWRTLK
jgi:hypothetical protein